MTSLPGSRNGQAKLIDEDVVDIRLSKLTNTELARQYGVRPEHISGIRKGSYWKHTHPDRESICTARHCWRPKAAPFDECRWHALGESDKIDAACAAEERRNPSHGP